MVHDTCVYCGSNQLADGSVQSTGVVHFRPVGAKFLSFRTADVAVQSRMCLQCGAIHMRGDVEKLREIRTSA